MFGAIAAGDPIGRHRHAGGTNRGRTGCRSRRNAAWPDWANTMKDCSGNRNGLRQHAPNNNPGSGGGAGSGGQGDGSEGDGQGENEGDGESDRQQ